ncbi:MAG TPA: glycosyltransferase [Vicinamibacteria bacterium]|nr:glycosyltransferase [Vicinamibacteria bacterium]
MVIPCRDRADLLRACLEAVVAQPESLLGEVVVVDASDGGEVAAVVRDFPRVRHLAAGAQVLPGPARNLGAAATADPFLAFLDADCRPAPAWLGAAAETLATPGARMVGGPVLDARPGHPVAAAAHFLQNAERGPGRPAGAAPYLPGPNLAMRRAAFQAVGPFVDRAAEDYLLTRTAAVRWPVHGRSSPSLFSIVDLGGIRGGRARAAEPQAGSSDGRRAGVSESRALAPTCVSQGPIRIHALE